jgi:glycosyltransferase involved in cell wall biosynthesis
VIVVDDGSTDDSRELLRRHAPDVAVLEKANGGQLSVAIAALAHISSDHVYFLDADDRALPDLVAEVSNVLSNRPVKVQFPLRALSADLVATGSVSPPCRCHTTVRAC